MKNSRRERMQKNLDNALFKEALGQWIGWLITLHGTSPRRMAGVDETGTVYDTVIHSLGGKSGQYSNPTVGALLRQEWLRYDWPASIHAIIIDMPYDWRVCLLGAALDYSQSTIAELLEVRQQLVSAMLTQARQTLLQRLRVLARTNRVLGELGVGREA